MYFPFSPLTFNFSPKTMTFLPELAASDIIDMLSGEVTIISLNPNIPATAPSVFFSFAIISNLQRLLLLNFSFNTLSISGEVLLDVEINISKSFSSQIFITPLMTFSTSSFFNSKPFAFPPINTPIPPLSPLIIPNLPLASLTAPSVILFGAPSVITTLDLVHPVGGPIGPPTGWTGVQSCLGRIIKSIFLSRPSPGFIITAFLALFSYFRNIFGATVDDPQEITISAYLFFTFSKDSLAKQNLRHFKHPWHLREAKILVRFKSIFVNLFLNFISAVWILTIGFSFIPRASSLEPRAPSTISATPIA